jgi:virginiamycin B lyase
VATPTSTVTTTAVPATTSTTQLPTTTTSVEAWEIEAFPVPPGTHPHDVAPAADGGVWYTAQHTGALGHLDPTTGEITEIALGAGSAPHGVIVDDAGTPWITDGGLNAIASVDPADEEVTVYPLPEGREDANLNTAVFDGEGILWFTGQNGIYGRLDPTTGDMEVFDAPRGTGPYGITVTPTGEVYYASLAGNYVGRIMPDGSAEVLEPPTPFQGARRVWSDSEGSVWVSEWNSGQVSRYQPASDTWTTWDLPGDAASYAVYVDDTDAVWLSDFNANAMVRFDPVTETFTEIPLPHNPGDVRQILGRPGEVWGAESSADQLIVVRPVG